MKKIITLFSLIGLLCIGFVSCKKDSEEVATNYVKIEGTFTIGEKEYISPTFDLGNPEDHEAQLNTVISKNTYNGITIIPAQAFDLGNDNSLMYYMEINSAEVGPAQMYCNFRINSAINKSTSLFISNDEVNVNITKIGEVGGYIEGTYESDFYLSGEKQAPFHVKGKFKVKRYESINNIKQ